MAKKKAAPKKKATPKKKAAPKKKPAKAAPKKKATPAAAKPSGRPPGAANHSRDVVRTVRAACTACGSTDRRVERIAKEQARPGVVHGGEFAGFEYTHTVWRDTACKDCGKRLREISHENRPDAEPAEPIMGPLDDGPVRDYFRDPDTEPLGAQRMNPEHPPLDDFGEPFELDDYGQLAG